MIDLMLKYNNISLMNLIKRIEIIIGIGQSIWFFNIFFSY